MPSKTKGTVISIRLLGAPFNVGPEAHNEYAIKELVADRFSNRNKSGSEYFSRTFLVIKELSLDILSSAFLFSTARNNARRPIVRRNHGDIAKLAATPPAIALNKKPDEMQNKSSIGSFFSLMQ